MVDVTIRFGAGPIMHGSGRTVVRETFAATLGAAIGDFVEILALPDYDALAEAIGSGALDFAWLPPAVYVSQEARGVSLLLACGRVAGTEYRGALFVPQASPLKQVSDLAGARVAWVDARSSAGCLFPRVALKLRGLNPDLLFSEQKILGSHGAVVRAVALGEVDVGATYITTDLDRRPTRRGWDVELAPEAMRLMLVTEPIPSDVICAGPKATKEQMGAMSSALMGLHDDSEGRRALMAFFGALRLEPSLPSHYEGVRAACGI